MTFPEWLKPGVYGAVIGAVAISIGGFSWGGWLTGGSASKMANDMARDEVTLAMVPLCIDNARSDPDRNTHLAAISEATTYKRRAAMMATGWATLPGGAEPDGKLAVACLAALDDAEIPMAEESTVTTVESAVDEG